MKCDRSHPCENCAKRGLGSQCAYPAAATPKPGQSHGSGRGVRDRLQDLEDQVVSMMNKSRSPEIRQGAHIATPSDSGASVSVDDHPHDQDNENSPPVPDFTQMKVSGPGTTYTDGAHWSSLLSGISKLREQTETEPECQPPQSTTSAETAQPCDPGPLLLYGCTPVSCREELIAGIPPKNTVNRLLSLYFRALDLSSSK